ncbi:MAG: 2-C-methyl-D-erythritol 2,4-cyclodiphosphate synthase [Ignavibacteriales bacterium]|nr:2-C-methyl-D-erythritol 2,4-cyclodiphosphate synthase [Ignavibacteriales bacterium]
MKFRIGNGYDVHQLIEGRKLILGGVEIPSEKGLLGHSDADVLLHAIMDAMLGALSLGDIGKHFPDTDKDYKDIDSKLLLQKAIELVKERGYQVVNCDSVLVLEKPKIAPYVHLMKKTISGIIGCGEDDISIKATTSEKLGFIGREEGAVAYAVVLLQTLETRET